MISTRPTLLLVSALAFGACHAQNAVRIADASALVNVTTVQDDHVVEAALAAAGSSEIETRAVMASGNKMLWPAGIRGDSARSANAAFIQDYRCFRVGTFPRDSTMMAIVAIPALENMDMPEAMRPDSDLYMVLPERALRAAAPPRLRPLVSKGPSWENRAKVKIQKPEAVYAAYNIGADSAAVKAMESAGMSKAEIAAVVFRSTERNWPDGIDSFEERWPELSLFKKYRAYLGAKWGNKALVIVPVQENQKMPALMRPFVDMYFVYDADALLVKAN
ncbi:MAG: hypothetical protein LKM36_10165 [Flavobacteriales bacterium]|jgi:hypothetical protein|nr:hypothetical protein [Flavobacteriales bacterium]MCI1753204.1 hypothetical protein [Flavobacteriales bacterium]